MRPKRTTRRIAALVVVVLTLAPVLVSSSPASARVASRPSIGCSLNKVTVHSGLDGLGRGDYYRVTLWSYNWNTRQWFWTGRRYAGHVQSTVVGSDPARVTFNVRTNQYYVAKVQQWTVVRGRWQLQANSWAGAINNLGWWTGKIFCRTGVW